jgi:hypothetical protein
MGTTDRAGLWNALTLKLASGGWSEQDVHPLAAGMTGLLVPVLNRFAQSFKSGAGGQLRRVIETGNTVHFLFNIGSDEYCASVLLVNGCWYFHHLEAISIDLSNPPELPCTGASLPGLPEQQLDWMREEAAMTERVRLFNFLAAQKSRACALDWFRDGAGFALAARAWIPYFEPRLALLWYAAWSETYLHGNPVTVLRIDENNSTIRLADPLHWRLYRQTVHLKAQIGEPDYEALFDIVWQDRAKCAGWSLDIVRDERGIDLRFTSQPLT